jgi:Zn-dependent peptidase ImmA (M78 family)
MSRVAIKKSVLRWAVDRASLTPDDLQHKFPKIRQWATGESQPTLRQLEDLAKTTLTPLGFFFLTEPPDERLPIPHFRTLGKQAPGRPSPHLLETIQVMQRRQAWMREFLIEQGQEPLTFVRSAEPDDPPATVADRIRHALNLKKGWAALSPTWTDALRALRETMEDAGILVAVNGIVGNNTHRKLDPEEFRGFVLVDEYAPLVFVNSVDGKAAQMFTLAHELAHVFLGSSAAFDLREMQPADDPMEKACNCIAAEFLIPEQEIRRIWPSVKDKPGCFQEIARQFKVSELVAARRALDLSLINKNAFLDFYGGYQRRATSPRSEGGDFYATQNLRVGRRFASAVVRAVNEGKLLYSEAYQMTGMYGKTFERYAESLRIGERR